MLTRRSTKLVNLTNTGEGLRSDKISSSLARGSSFPGLILTLSLVASRLPTILVARATPSTVPCRAARSTGPEQQSKVPDSYVSRQVAEELAAT